MADFVLREWNLAPYPGDQAPPHIHHRSDEAFIGRSEIDELIQALHSGSDEPMTAIWARYNASVAKPD